MHDLNSLQIFSQVVAHNGFTGAAQAMGVARSSICRRVRQLEERLGIRLVQRNTRHFAVTDLGMEFHGYCVKMMEEAQAAYDRVACLRAKPAGVIRVSCPAMLTHLVVGPVIPKFVEKNPEVRIAIEASERKVDIRENLDLWIRVRQIPSEDSGLVMRSLGIIQQVLVASPAFLDRYGRPTSPSEAIRMHTLSYGVLQGPHVWKLVDRQEKELQIRHEPKFVADDMFSVRQAAMQGIGIAQLPLAVCANEIEQKLLEIVLPGFRAPLCEIQIVFPSRRGMLPAVRSFIDYLAANFASELPEWQIKRHTGRGHRDGGPFWTSREPVANGRSLGGVREAQVA